MSKRKQRLFLLMLPLILGPLLAWSVLTALAGSQTVPLKGQFSGAGNQFSGQITHLGQFDGIFDPDSHSAFFIAANGDMMKASYCPEESEICDQVQELVITGGTGRFAFAGGSAIVTGDVNPGDGGAYNGRIEGSLTWQVPNDGDLYPGERSI